MQEIQIFRYDYNYYQDIATNISDEIADGCSDFAINSIEMEQIPILVRHIIPRIYVSKLTKIAFHCKKKDYRKLTKMGQELNALRYQYYTEPENSHARTRLILVLNG